MTLLSVLANPSTGMLFGVFFILSIIRKSKYDGTKEKGLFLKKRPEKKCLKCQGFGIVRCDLCSGKGFVLYERKFQRSDPCPKCFQKRYDMCHYCQGRGDRFFFKKI
jgi:hypothetical protein